MTKTYIGATQMSSANKRVLQYAVETTNGVTPTPFARKTIPYSGTTLTQK